MATKEQYDAARERVEHSPTLASERDWQLVGREAEQAGLRGSAARTAASGGQS